MPPWQMGACGSSRMVSIWRPGRRWEPKVVAKLSVPTSQLGERLGIDMIRLIPAFVVLAPILFQLGCGSSGSYSGPSYGSEEGRKIAQFVDYFNDYVVDANKFKKAFASGNVPAN